MKSQTDSMPLSLSKIYLTRTPHPYIMPQLKLTGIKSVKSAPFSLSEVCIFLFAAAIGLLTYYTPLTAEDIVFSSHNRYYLDGETDAIDFPAIASGIYNHFFYSNGRLCDKIPVLILCLMPKWLIAMLNAIAAWFLAKGICRLATFRESPTSGIWITLFVICILLSFFPWCDTMLLVSYSLNYLWTCALLAWVMPPFIDTRTIGDLSRKRFAGLAALFFVAGLWHEMVFLLSIASMAALCLLSTGKCMKRRLILTAALTIGFVLVMSSPAHQSRVERTPMEFSIANILGEHLVKPNFMTFASLLYLFTLLTYVILGNDSWKGLKSKLISLRQDGNFTYFRGLNVFCALICLSSLGILCIYNYFRLTSVSVTFSAAGLASLFLHWHYPLRHWVITSAKAVLAAAASLLCLNTILATIQQKRWAKVYDEITAVWRDSQEEVIYYDLPEVYAVGRPWSFLTQDIYFSNWKLDIVTYGYYPDKSAKPYIVVPTSLKQLTAANMHCIDDKHKICAYGDYLISHSDLVPPREGIDILRDYFTVGKLYAVTDNGRHVQIPLRISEPIKGADGQYYRYLMQTGPKFAAASLVAVDSITLRPRRLH